MTTDKKLSEAYKTIGEVAKELDLIDEKTGNLQTHTIRYWESQFAQIKPTVRAGNRRYFSPKDFKIIKHIKFLLKEKGLTINGVKKILKETKETDYLDDKRIFDIHKDNFKSNKVIKEKLRNISNIVKQLKKFK